MLRKKNERTSDRQENVAEKTLITEEDATEDS